MTPDDFRAELCTALISFYEGILKVPGACGRPAAQIIKRRFAGKPADAPPAAAASPPAAAAPPPAEVSTAAGGAGVTSRDPTPDPPAAAAAEAALAAGKQTRVKGGAGKGAKG